MGFNNPLTGENGSLIYPQIKSPNYQQGNTGWIISKTGSAEFNDLVIRGTFDGSDFIFNNSGLFIYSGTPANGNLICSVAPVSGTDEFGNNYIPGIASYNIDSESFAQIVLGMVNVGAIVGGTADTDDAASFSYIPNGGQSFMQAASPLNQPTYSDNALMLLQAGKPSGGLDGIGRPLALFIDNLGSSACDINVSGSVLRTSLDGVTVETWHDAVLNSQWSGATGGYYAPQYRLNADGSIAIRGAATFTSNGVTGLTSGAAILTLPSGYCPSERTDLPVAIDGAVSSITANQVPHVEISTTGVINVYKVTSSATNGTQVTIYLNFTFYP